MHQRHFIASFIVLLASLVSLSLDASASDARAEATVDSAKPKVGSLVFEDCEYESHNRRRKVDCASLTVAEDYSEPTGKLIDIAIVRLRAASTQPQDDPVLMIAGGPGQGAIESFLFADKALHKLARNRDIYLIDQRGTGHSSRQSCEIDPFSSIGVDSNSTEYFPRIREILTECFAKLSGDARMYTTSAAIRDFENIRKALDIQQWNLFGVSYGTRVEQHYMKVAPDAIRTAVLDSVVPLSSSLGPEIPALSQKALDVFLSRCENEKACAKAYPSLRTDLHALFARLTKGPETVRFENLRSGEFETIDFTLDHLVSTIRMALYNTKALSVLPPMLHEASANSNFAPLARDAVKTLRAINDMLAFGMHNSVMCTEDYPFYALSDGDRQAMAASYMGDQIVDLMEIACSIWPQGQIDKDFKVPLKSTIPVLLLSGSDDPITPPKYAEQVKIGLKNSKHFVLSGQGHSVSFTACTPTIIAKFIDEGHLDNINDNCLKRLKAAPLFIDFNGPDA
ncbi:MAG: pimeloyl-ACP methyl ester carboxylesterase [Flavobacteriales bacterium]|jgi:pimeloyl-ACP methyl ester carboxylesterase